jgi:hypothetical protein
MRRLLFRPQDFFPFARQSALRPGPAAVLPIQFANKRSRTGLQRPGEPLQGAEPGVVPRAVLDPRNQVIPNGPQPGWPGAGPGPAGLTPRSPCAVPCRYGSGSAQTARLTPARRMGFGNKNPRQAIWTLDVQGRQSRSRPAVAQTLPCLRLGSRPRACGAGWRVGWPAEPVQAAPAAAASGVINLRASRWPSVASAAGAFFFCLGAGRRVGWPGERHEMPLLAE